MITREFLVSLSPNSCLPPQKKIWPTWIISPTCMTKPPCSTDFWSFPGLEKNEKLPKKRIMEQGGSRSLHLSSLVQNFLEVRSFAKSSPKRSKKDQLFFSILFGAPGGRKLNISKSSNISWCFPLRPVASRSPCLHRRAIPRYPFAQKAGCSSTTPSLKKKYMNPTTRLGNHLFVWQKNPSLLSAGMESYFTDALRLPMKRPWAVDGSASWWIPIGDHPSFKQTKLDRLVGFWWFICIEICAYISIYT